MYSVMSVVSHNCTSLNFINIFIPEARRIHTSSVHTGWKWESSPQSWRCEASVLTTVYHFLQHCMILATNESHRVINVLALLWRKNLYQLCVVLPLSPYLQPLRSPTLSHDICSPSNWKHGSVCCCFPDFLLINVILF